MKGTKINISIFYFINYYNSLFLLSVQIFIMQIKIHIAEKPVYICNRLNEELAALTHLPDCIFVDEVSTAAIKSLLHEIHKPEIKKGIIVGSDIEALKKLFFKQFKVIEAAGGIVQNEEKEILFIFRKGKWDLPKGKVEPKEDVETAAAREIEEETGVKNLQLKKKIHTTYHTYKEYGKDILKISHWFYFICPTPQNLTPQTEEDITEVQWIATKDIKTPMANTYSSIKELMHSFFDTP